MNVDAGKLVVGVGVRWAESGAGQRPSSGNNQSVDRPISKPNGSQIFLPPPAQAKRFPVSRRQISTFGRPFSPPSFAYGKFA